MAPDEWMAIEMGWTPHVSVGERCRRTVSTVYVPPTHGGTRDEIAAGLRKLLAPKVAWWQQAWTWLRRVGAK